MLGESGTAGGSGTAPRLATVNAHRSDAPWPTHSHAPGSCPRPSVALSGASVRALAWPVAVWPTQSSMRSPWVWVNAKREPSGEKPIQPMAGDGGSVTVGPVPSAGLVILSDRKYPVRCRPLVFGL